MPDDIRFDGIRWYLKLLRDTNHNPLAEYLLAHGRAFETDAGSFIGGEPHHCFRNSALAVLLTDDKLTYVEGYVEVCGVALPHAWTVDQDDMVRDLTIGDGEHVTGYFGVSVERSFLGRAVIRKGSYGLLTGEDHWPNVERVIAGKLPMPPHRRRTRRD